MSEFVLKTKEQETEAKQPDVQFESLPDELEGAVKAEGIDEVEEAMAEVVTGVAQPEALLEWIDDLRDPEEQVETEDDNLERSFTMDFVPDTARDGGATESPPGEDYMFFSANRRGPLDDDDEGGGGGGGGGGDGAGDGEGEGEAGGGDDKKKSAANAAKAKPAKPEGKQPAPKPAAPTPASSNKKPDGK